MKFETTPKTNTEQEDKEKNEIKKFVLQYPMVSLRNFQYIFLKHRDILNSSFGTDGIHNFLKPGEKGVDNSYINKIKNMKSEEIESFFDYINKDIDLQFLCLSQIKRKAPGASTRELAGFKFEKIEKISDLSEVDISSMKKIYSNNYEQKPILRDVLLETFGKVLSGECDTEDKTNVFNIVRFKGEVVGFFIMEYDKKENVSRFKSFNVDSEYVGRGIGSDSLDSILKEEAKSRRIKAESICDSSICSKYVEDFGFVGVSTIDICGEQVLNLLRNDSHKDLLKFKDLPEKHLFNMAVFNMEIKPEPGVSVTICQGEENFRNKLEKKLKKNCLLTRNIKYATDEGEILFLFVIEELSDEDYQSFMSDNKELNSDSAYIV